MVQKPPKVSITKGKGTGIVTKYSISYIRVSTKKQTKSSTSGVVRQEDLYGLFQKFHPEYKNLDGYEARDLGVSGRGKNSTHGALAKIIKDANKGLIPPETCVVVENFNRLTRQPYLQAYKLLISVIDAGLHLNFPQYGMTIFKAEGNDPLWDNIAGAIKHASIEWEYKQGLINGHHDRIAKMLEKRDLSFFKSRVEGKGLSMYPFWLQFDEKINEFYVIPKWGELVKRICDMAITMGSKKIAWKLKEEGITNVSGRFFAPNTIRQTILDHRGLLGEKIHRDKSYKGIYPPIITPELFDMIHSSKEERKLNNYKKAPKRQMVNLFQGLIFCSECGGLMQVARKETIKCKKANQKNGEKIYIEYENIYCDRAKTKRTCKATNSAPYIQKHRNIDNELKILQKISNHRWEEFFTDEKHENELRVQVESRQRFLHERNKIQGELDNFKKANIDYLKQGRVVPIELENLQKESEEKYDEINSKYNRSKLDIQNLKRKKTGKEFKKDIQERVQNFINKDRFIPEKREEFNIWLKEIGLAVTADIEVTGSNPRKSANNNYFFDTGVAMFDFITGEFKGLNQVEEAANAFGMDMKQVREEEAKRRQNYKEQSLKAGRDIRFPKPKKKIDWKPLTKETKFGKELITYKEKLNPLFKKIVEVMEKNDKK